MEVDDGSSKVWCFWAVSYLDSSYCVGHGVPGPSLSFLGSSARKTSKVVGSINVHSGLVRFYYRGHMSQWSRTTPENNRLNPGTRSERPPARQFFFLPSWLLEFFLVHMT